MSASRIFSIPSAPSSSSRKPRAYNSIYEYQGQEINQTDLISAYGELYFKDAFGKDPRGNDRPLTVRAGRFHPELLTRRLIAENEFRNTTNNFDGFRIKIGKKDNDWDLDNFLMRPVIRYPYQFDRPDWQNWIYGSVFSFRQFSEYATVQPYFLGRTQYGDQLNTSTALKTHRETYAPGLRIYGVLGNFDYDFDINKQFGSFGRLQTAVLNGQTYDNIEVTVPHDALAWGLEAGYTFLRSRLEAAHQRRLCLRLGQRQPVQLFQQQFRHFLRLQSALLAQRLFRLEQHQGPEGPPRVLTGEESADRHGLQRLLARRRGQRLGSRQSLLAARQCRR